MVGLVKKIEIFLLLSGEITNLPLLCRIGQKYKPVIISTLYRKRSTCGRSKVCNFWGHKNFKEKEVQYIYKHNNHFLFVNDVPCEECEHCGEQYFKANVLKKIEKSFIDIYSARKTPKKEIKVPLENYPELALTYSFLGGEEFETIFIRYSPETLFLHLAPLLSTL
jgi:YgiT-type zinc finger domain-containing protein